MKIYDCLNAALSSILILLSQIRTFPSIFMPIGLIYNKVESVPINTLYSLRTMSLSWVSESSGTLKLAMILSNNQWGISGSDGKNTFQILFGSTYQIFPPPFSEDTTPICPELRSNKNERYSYFLKKAFSTRKTSLHFFP